MMHPEFKWENLSKKCQTIEKNGRNYYSELHY